MVPKYHQCFISSVKDCDGDFLSYYMLILSLEQLFDFLWLSLPPLPSRVPYTFQKLNKYWVKNWFSYFVTASLSVVWLSLNLSEQCISWWSICWFIKSLLKNRVNHLLHIFHVISHLLLAEKDSGIGLTWQILWAAFKQLNNLQDSTNWSFS